ncbi:putative metabolite transport protein YwtG [Pullulanibacillus camelliae]|uniref:Putative metabolite transport protein YwtG n=1 Tax=Pullulanibacillus camelliae TaxID=1707096 RepID=A0A8J2YEW5_9BACL|nr:sugar porter family MFS transporter [Pullulanibacillus camelliae]GGE27659.1 putative metabolite transport protein YwtG [Pullulanibacillus camelliae]
MSEKIASNKSIMSIFIFGALADLLFGYDTGVMGVALLFIKKQMTLSPSMQGWVVSSLLIGAMIGVAIAGILADKFGRRKIILITAVAFGIGAIGAAVAPDVSLLIISRFIMGLGVGAASVVVTIYLSEMAPTNKRGILTALNQLMVTLGILLSYIVDYSLAPFEAWRWMLGIALVPSIIVFIGICFQPETPRWLVKNGFEDKALQVLTRLVGKLKAEQELNEIKTFLDAEKINKQSTVFTPKIRLMIIVAAFIAMFPQIMGTNSIIYYAPTMLTTIGFGGSAAILANVAIGALNFLMTFVAMKLIDNVGRKPMLLCGTVGMGLGMLTLGIVFHSSHSHPSTGSGVIALIAMLVFIGSFATTWGTITRILISELLPLKFRGSIMGYVLVLNWGFNFLIGLIFPIVLNGLGASVMFFIFMGIAIIAFFFVLLLVPETKQRSLEEIEQSMRA